MPPKGAKKKTVVRPSRNEIVSPETPSTSYVWNEVDKRRKANFFFKTILGTKALGLIKV